MQPDPDRLDERSTQDLAVALGNTGVITECWESDGEGIQPDGIMGGDGAGESVSVRYLNRHLPNAQITTYYYVVDMRDRDLLHDAYPGSPASFVVEEMVDFFIASGPISDVNAPEAWSDSEYHSHDREFTTEAAAEAFRDRLAKVDRAATYTWNGNPW